MLERRNEWLAAVPAFQDVQNWVEVHWNTERQTQPPAGTVSAGDQLGNQGEVQLDALTATCKLLLAADEAPGRHSLPEAANAVSVEE